MTAARRRWARAAVLVLAALAVAAAGGLLWLRTSLPHLDGRLALAGLDAPVAIARDARGVPAIRAQSEHDAYFALGVVHAQDRLFQMEFMRRLGTGTLSEVMGEATLRHDRFVRTLGLARLAEESFARLDPPVQDALRAYADGVNAWLDSRTGALPPEYYLLRTRPEPWRPSDSLLWGRLMALRVTDAWRGEMLRAALLSRLTPQQVEELWPAYPADMPRGVARAAPGDEPAAALPGKGSFWHRLLAALPATLESHSASNAWAVAGTRTAAGAPILANDPHLPLETPAVWYLARIEAPGLSVAGATAPGVPFVILGHNARIAWGFTTTHSDTQDLFVERIAPGDPGRYLVPGGSEPFATREEVIDVRGGAPVRVTVRATRHGPVVSDAVSFAEAVLGGATDRVLALADAALRPDDRTAAALYRLNRASGWDSFVDALRDFHSPQQNIVYAGVDGHIGFVAPGRVPLRASGNGLFPVPGWTGEHDWTGFIPFDDLPRVRDPDSGQIVSANHRIVGDDYPHLIAARWPPPYRARRIAMLLESGAGQDMNSTAAMQLDAVSTAARDLLPRLLAAPARGASASAAHDLLAAWDGEMARDRPEPLVFAAWMTALNRALFADELGPDFASFRLVRPLLVQSVLTEKTRWCDDVGTSGVETCDDIIATALDAAIESLAHADGGDMRAWRWGAAHEARFRHPVFSRLGPLAPFVEPRIETGGDDNTINRGTYGGRADPAGRAGESFTQIHGAQLRAVYDLSDPDSSRFMIAPGQSGNPFSPHFDDLVRAWRDGESFTLPAAGAHAPPPAHRLVLVPEGRSENPR